MSNTDIATLLAKYYRVPSERSEESSGLTDSGSGMSNLANIDSRLFQSLNLYILLGTISSGRSSYGSVAKDRSVNSYSSCKPLFAI